MSRSFKNFFSRIPPSVGIVGALIAVVAVASVVLLLSRSEPKAAAFVPNAARIERVDGSVGVARALTEPAASELEWEEAVRNAPLSVGDRVYAREGSRATVALTGRNYARLDSNSALDVLSLGDRRTQLALRDGSAIFDVGDLEDGELFEVATPNGAVDFNEPGLYQVGVGDDGNSWISVLSGLAEVVGLAGSGEISKGEILTLVGQTAAQGLLSRMAPDFAGGVVDDYYGYRYPNSYDGRYSDYNVYLDDPDYYDPYSRSTSYRYVTDDIPGVYDLDHYGDWTDVEGYGHCWSPRVDADWAPYRNGYWDVDNVYGPTWISQESWGWAPYHYGRWANVNNGRWVWVPDRARTRSVYAPALVAFVPLTESNHIGWVPLAPGEHYVPRYYDASFQPQYLASHEVVTQGVTYQRTFINAGIPHAVTVVPVQDFTRVIDRNMITNVNPEWIARSQPVLDPFAIEGMRQMASSKREYKRRIKMERAFTNQFNTSVVTSAAPVVMPGREGAINSFQVAGKQKKQKIKINDSGQIVTARTRDGEIRPQLPQMNADTRIDALRAQAAQGDKAARREMKQLKREQRNQQGGQGVVLNPAQPQVQSDVTRSERKAQKRAERQQRVGQQGGVVQQNQPRFNQQAANSVERQQRKAQKRVERQQQQNAATVQRQQQTIRQPQIDQQARQQRKAQKRAERQQRVGQQGGVVQQNQPSFNQQAAHNAELEQRRAQKRAAREQRVNQQSVNQQRMIQQQQQQQQQAKQRVFIQQTEKQQRKAERRAVREQQAQQQQARPQQQVRPQAPQQIRVQPRVQHQGPPVNQGSVDAAQAQRRAAKAERKAARKNQ